jgi:3-oxoacyl-[acyl-carrier protein] reductase
MKAQGAGSIIIVSSISGSMVGGGMPSYNVAKAAEIMHARTLARDLASFGIRANTVSPGSIMFDGGGWARRQESHPGEEAGGRDQPSGGCHADQNPGPYGCFGFPRRPGSVEVDPTCAPSLLAA